MDSATVLPASVLPVRVTPAVRSAASITSSEATASIVGAAGSRVSTVAVSVFEATFGLPAASVNRPAATCTEAPVVESPAAVKVAV